MTLTPRALLLLLLLLALPAVVLAHGGGTPQLVNQPVGPYWLSAWTSPDPPRVGQLHLTFGLAEPGEGREAGAPVLGATVRLRLQPAAAVAASPITTLATNENAANRLFYEADVTVPAAGAWQVRIQVEGPDGQGTASFPLQVQPLQTTNWLLLGGGGVLLVVALFALFTWRRQTPPSDATTNDPAQSAL